MKILAIDDDAKTLEALEIGLGLQLPGAEVLTAATGEAGLDAFFDHEPDVVLLDVGLPDQSGFDVLRQIRRVAETPILLLTGRAGEADEVHGLELGADGYVTKPFGHLALLARIKAVLRRAELPPPERALPPFVAGPLAIDFAGGTVAVGGTPVILTPVEYRLLYHLVRNAGHLLSHEALADHVWGRDYGASPEHLKVFVSRLRRKLEAAGAPRCIETERGQGYRFARPQLEASAA